MSIDNTGDSGGTEIMMTITTMPQQPLKEAGVAETILPQGYELLGAIVPLSMILTRPSWLVVPAFEQRLGRYGLLIFTTETGKDTCENVIAFLSSPHDIDALCALVEFCLLPLSYWDDDISTVLCNNCRTVWWMAQTALAQQALRIAHQEAEGSLPQRQEGVPA